MPRQSDIALPRSGGGALAARIEHPAGPPRAAALFAHCFACSKDSHGARRVSRALAARGIATLRFDMGGVGASADPGGIGGPGAQARDIADAAAWMADQGLAPGLLVGHSLGGAAALIAAPAIPSVKAVAVIGAPADPAHALARLGDALARIDASGAADVALGPGPPVRVTRAFVDGMRGADVLSAAADLGRALLILHAPRDDMVGIDHASRLFLAAKHPKSFVSLDDADHLLTRPADAAYAADLIAAWASRYLDMAAPEAPNAPEGVVRVTETDPGGFRQDILVGRHALVADEPASVGGGDAGPSPYGLVAAGLGACTAMTIRMHARRKGLALDDVTVEVTHAKVHGADCADCDAPGARIDRFDRVIRLTGALTEAERARLMQIADRCPVHRTLEGASQIVTRAAPLDPAAASWPADAKP